MCAHIAKAGRLYMCERLRRLRRARARAASDVDKIWRHRPAPARCTSLPMLADAGQCYSLLASVAQGSRDSAWALSATWRRARARCWRPLNNENQQTNKLSLVVRGRSCCNQISIGDTDADADDTGELHRRRRQRRLLQPHRRHEFPSSQQ